MANAERTESAEEAGCPADGQAHRSSPPPAQPAKARRLWANRAAGQPMPPKPRSAAAAGANRALPFRSRRRQPATAKPGVPVAKPAVPPATSRPPPNRRAPAAAGQARRGRRRSRPARPPRPASPPLRQQAQPAQAAPVSAKSRHRHDASARCSIDLGYHRRRPTAGRFSTKPRIRACRSARSPLAQRPDHRRRSCSQALADQFGMQGHQPRRSSSRPRKRSRWFPSRWPAFTRCCRYRSRTTC